ncbi:hypothetical protein [Spongiimicrobium salis]|uniref:hypothetical protein n=1 Tax=Spongiimicrobium salis TaxID=1667022 RepID=UPI00374D9574
METKNYLDDITEIKQMMHRSSRFLSLSGLSGVLAGIYALIGAYIAKQQIQNYVGPTEAYRGSDSIGLLNAISSPSLMRTLLLIAIIVVALAMITGVLLSIKKSKKSGEKLWDVSSKRLFVNFFIPLVAGGLFCMALLQNRYYDMIAPATLIFYGLACVNASKHTIGDVRYLGMANIVIGIISTQFLGYGLYFWALGFGFFHIFYGALMYFKHDRS